MFLFIPSSFFEASIMTTQPSSSLPWWSLLWDVLTAPRRAFEHLAEAPSRSWWLPALLALLLPIVQVAVSKDLLAEQAKKAALQQLSAMPPDQAEAARAAMTRFFQPAFILLTSSLSLVAALVTAWIFAMIILYFGIALLGRPVKAGVLWPAVAWSWLPLALRPLVQSAWVLYSGTLMVNQGLSFLVATGDPIQDSKNPLYMLASQVDLFNLWHLVLIYLLLRAVGKLGRGSAVFVLVVYVLFLGGAHVIPTLAMRLFGFG